MSAGASAGDARARVLYLISSLGQGGAERLVLDTVKGLDPARFDPALCVVHDVVHFSGQLPDGEPRFPLRRRLWSSPATWMGIARALRQFSPHVFHCHLDDGNLWGRLVARAARFPGPVVTSVHLAGMQPHYKAAERLLYRLSTVVLAHSRSIGRFLVEEVGVPASKVRVIANAIDVSRYAPGGPAERAAARAGLGLPPDAFVALMPARVSRQKNQDLVVEALASLRAEGRLPANFRLLLAGKLSSRSVTRRVKAIVERAGLGEQVALLGPVRDMVSTYRAADCVLMPSRVEGLPLAALESMAMEVPVLLSEAANSHEVVLPGENGWVIPTNDVAALARALPELWGAPAETLRGLGRAGRAHVLAHFDNPRMFAELETLYDELLAAAKEKTP